MCGIKKYSRFTAPRSSFKRLTQVWFPPGKGI